MIGWRFSLVLLWALVTACNSPTIDASSEQALEESVAEVRTSLDSDLRLAFDSALAVVTMAGVDAEGLIARTLAGGEAGLTGLKGTVMSELDGLTAREVIAKGDSLRMSHLEVRHAEMEESIRTHEEAEGQLARVELAHPELDVTGPDFFSTARLHVIFTNNLDRTIETALISLELISPDREVPWVEEEDVYIRFEGGIAPGETRADIGYLANRWVRHDAPDDAELRVQLSRIGFPDESYIGSRGDAFSSGRHAFPSQDSLQSIELQMERLRQRYISFETH